MPQGSCGYVQDSENRGATHSSSLWQRSIHTWIIWKLISSKPAPIVFDCTRTETIVQVHRKVVENLRTRHTIVTWLSPLHMYNSFYYKLSTNPPLTSSLELAYAVSMTTFTKCLSQKLDLPKHYDRQKSNK